jgi:hypothetical protein
MARNFADFWEKINCGKLWKRGIFLEKEAF